jgi:hypothetical protein
MHCNKEEEKKEVMARERKKRRSSKGENVCTFGMHHNRKETKSFNAKEKVKMMAMERKRVFIEGK